MNTDVMAAAVRFKQQRQAFVMASVIWRRGPSSGQQGSQALILPDGRVQGFLGGACAEPAVISEAMQCLGHGEPRLLCLGESPERIRQNVDSSGLRQIAMSCESEGAMEIYLEPAMPAPQVIVVGRTPATDAIASVALALGWDALIVDDGGIAADHAHPELVRTSLNFDDISVDTATAVVVATQGHYDDAALAAALGTKARYIGLVASAKRAEAMREYLQSQGFSSDQLDRIVAPAGMDLGRIPNREIAVAVMADLVARRAQGELINSALAAVSTRPTEAKDPVCGMTVLVDSARYRSTHNGTNYFFCAASCQQAFQLDPEAFTAS